MPCVFPILAMKAASLAGGAARGEVRAHGLPIRPAWSLAFVALAACCWRCGRRVGALGWGFQFQSPVLVAAMAWLLFVVGLNLSGVFEIGGALAGAGHGLARAAAMLGASAPALLAVAGGDAVHRAVHGHALGFALAAPPLVALLVFAGDGDRAGDALRCCSRLAPALARARRGRARGCRG